MVLGALDLSRFEGFNDNPFGYVQIGGLGRSFGVDVRSVAARAQKLRFVCSIQSRPMVQIPTFEKLLNPLRRAVRAGVVIIFSALVLVVFAQVIARSVFNAPFSWSEELARYLQVWLILLASAACVRKQLHLTVDYATHILAERTQRWLQIVAVGAVVFFLLVVIVSSVSLIAATGNQTTPALQIPMRAVYVALPLGALLMLLEALALAARLLAPADHRVGGGR